MVLGGWEGVKGGDIRPMNHNKYQLAEPLWTDTGCRSGMIGARELISTLKKKKRVGNDSSTFSPKSLHGREKPPQPQNSYLEDNKN